MMANRREKSGLGRGLSALMADIETSESPTTAPAPAEDGGTRRAPRAIPIDAIHPNPDQPRRAFSEEALNELAASIAEKGIIQPLILRPDPTGSDAFQIVAGERRWRAAQRAQLHEVPALVRDFSDSEVVEVAIIENIQRADLNALEEAQGYRQLMERFGHTQEHLSKAMGKSRSHIANLMRLLTLPDAVQDMVRDGRLSAGHARCLVTTEDPARLAAVAVEKGLSVRALEQLAKSGTNTGAPKPKPSGKKDADTVALEGDLSAALGMPVSIHHDAASGEGRLSIRYRDLQALDDLIRLLGG
jgi:ParB family chromosome partitioning protein